MVKKSGIFKSIQFKVINIIAACTFICCMIGVAGGDKTIGTLDNFVVEMTGGKITENGGYTIDASDGINGNWLTISGFELTPGVYKYYVDYSLTSESDDDVNLIELHSIGGNYNELLSNPPHFYSGIDKLECEFYVTVSLDAGISYFTVDYKGTDSFTINDISIVKTTGLYKIVAFFTCLFAFIMDGVMTLYLYNKKFPMALEDHVVYLGLPTVYLVASIPLFINYMTFGHDYVFHLLRIEFLSKSLAQGIFPVRIEGTWLYGHGYANSIFYCDTFLMFPAFLRLFGFPMLWAYQGYVYLINLLTLLVAYFSFKGIFKNRIVAVIGAMLYILSPYRFYNVYNRAAVGEYTAMIFLPLLCLGFYKIFNDDIRKKEYKYNFLILVLGLSGIIQSHLLSGEMTGAVIIIVCLARIKKVFRKETFIELVKAVGGTVIANLWFLLPMADMMLSDEYLYANNGQRSIQNRGVFLSHLLFTLQSGNTDVDFHIQGMIDSGGVYIGIGVFAGVFFFLFLYIAEKKQNSIYVNLGRLALSIGCIFALMSTSVFPWDSLENVSVILSSVSGMLQFPTRLTVISTMAFCIVATVGIKWMLEQKGKKVKYVTTILLCVITIVFSMYQSNEFLYLETKVDLYSMENLGQSNIKGGEYLPMGSETCNRYHSVLPSDGVNVEAFEKNDLDTYTYVVAGDEEKEYYIDLPMLFYKGYVAENPNTGEVFDCCRGDKGHVRVALPAGYEGQIHVFYSDMWYWHIAEVISLCFWTAVFAWFIVKRHKSESNQGNLVSLY